MIVTFDMTTESPSIIFNIRQFTVMINIGFEYTIKILVNAKVADFAT